MKSLSTFYLYFVIVLGLVLQACSTDGYSDGESSSNSETVNEATGTQGNTDPYGEGDSESENSGNTLADENAPLSFTVTNIGAASYVFNNNDLDNEENPTIVLRRGITYTFNINAPGHPFLIKDVQETTTSDTYDEGISNNGTDNGTITFEVTEDTPDTLYYICEFHGSMSGTIVIED